MFCGCGRKKKKKAKGGKETIGEDDLPVPLVPSNVKDCKSADVKSAKTLLKPALKVSFSKDEVNIGLFFSSLQNQFNFDSLKPESFSFVIYCFSSAGLL